MLFLASTLLFIQAVSAATSAVASDKTALVVPLYSYPGTAGSSWDPLYSLIEKYTQQPFTVIVNPDSGPGTTAAPNDDYVYAVTKLNKYANVQTIGYFHIEYGNRSIADVENDIKLYAGWKTYNTNIALDGYFIDEFPSDQTYYVGSLAYVKKVYDLTVKYMGENVYNMGNPGIICDSAFFQYVNSMIIYEDVESDYAMFEPYLSNATIIPSIPNSRDGVIVYSWNGTDTELNRVVKENVAANVGFFYVQTADNYNEFTSNLNALVADVATANGL